MKRLKKSASILVLVTILSLVLIASEEALLNLKGSYLAYSRDFNQVYGENVEFKFSSYTVLSRYIKIDLQSSAFYAYGDVVLKKGEERLQGHEFLFDPKEKSGTLISYEDKIEVKIIGAKGKEPPNVISPGLDSLSLAGIKKSFIYFTGESMEITNKGDVYGYNVTLHVEGLESLGFKKFKLSGTAQRSNGLSLDRVWYTGTQGIIGRASYYYEKENKVTSLTRLNYEEHSVLKNYSGLKRQVDVMTSNTINIDKSVNLGLTGNYNSSNLWNTNLWLNKNWSSKFNTKVNFSYNKPVNLRGEAWLGLQSNVNAGKFGNISFSGRYELQNQISTNFSYNNNFFKRINLLLSSVYSKIKIGRSENYSEILSGGVSLSYRSQVFNLSTDYYLNYDLFGDQLLSQPQLRAGFNPFPLYRGLLTASIYNVFIYNKLKNKSENRNSYSNNSVFSLSTQPIFIQKDFSLNFNSNLEQFLEKEGRNFTSTGFIIRSSKTLIKGVSLEGMYTTQSRRKTEGWLIEGTTSQNLTGILKVNPSERINGWVSVSFDPKNNQWKQSFSDISIGIFRNWKFHTLLNYDFILRKINNVDLYLIRDAGLFQLRFVWRSLSKNFLIELIPKTR